MNTLQTERSDLGRFKSEITVAERLGRLSIPEPNSGCFIWIGGTDRYGYGRMTLTTHGRKHYDAAHRVAFTLAFGEIREGLFVLHRCDNPLCINPDHLFLGTQRDNCRDTARKGRGVKSKSGLPFGVKRHRSKFEAHIKRDGKMISLGLFHTAEEASAVATKEKLRYLALPEGEND